MKLGEMLPIIGLSSIVSGSAGWYFGSCMKSASPTNAAPPAGGIAACDFSDSTIPASDELSDDGMHEAGKLAKFVNELLQETKPSSETRAKARSVADKYFKPIASEPKDELYQHLLKVFVQGTCISAADANSLGNSMIRDEVDRSE